MKEPIIQLSLKDYEDLKQFKDNAFKKNFLAISKGCVLSDIADFHYNDFHFYSDEEMSQKLFSEIELLKSENTDLRNENSVLKSDLTSQIQKTISNGDEFANFYFQLKKMNIFQFLKWKKIINKN
jgi:hypothetical protein